MSDVAVLDRTDEIPAVTPVRGPRERPATWTGHPPADELVRRIVTEVDTVVSQRVDEWARHASRLHAELSADLHRMRTEHRALLDRFDSVLRDVHERLDALSEVAAAAGRDEGQRLAAHVRAVVGEPAAAAPDAGWYRSPDGGLGGLRWWDGEQWGADMRDLTVAPHLARLAAPQN